MRADRLSSLFWLVFGIPVVYLSYNLGLGELTRPGPGFLTFWCGLILCVLSMFVMVRGRIAVGEGTTKRIDHLWNSVQWSKAVVTLLALIAYALAFEKTGFLLSTITLLVVLFRAIDPMEWWAAMVVAVLASFVSFIIFGIIFQVQLPHAFPEIFLFKMKKIFF
jgi:putative tricarboxylic transport membrane protein